MCLQRYAGQAPSRLRLRLSSCLAATLCRLQQLSGGREAALSMCTSPCSKSAVAWMWVAHVDNSRSCEGEGMGDQV